MPQHPNMSAADSPQASPSDHHCQREGRSSKAEIDSMMQNAESFVLKASPTRPRLTPGTVYEAIDHSAHTPNNKEPKDKLERDDKKKIKAAVQETLECLEQNQLAEQGGAAERQ